MRILNRRVFVFLALSLMLGVFLGGLVFDNIILCISIPIAIAAVGVLFVFCKKPGVFAFFLCISVGIAAFCVDAVIYDAPELTEQHIVEARVERVGEGYCVVENLIIDGDEYAGKIKLNTGCELVVGDKIYLYGTPEKVEFFVFDSYSSWLYCKKINYEIDSEQVFVIGNEKKFSERVRDRITAPMQKFMDAEDMGIAKSLIFGDKSDLAYEDNELIRGTGLSHVFALSGLHVGFLMAIVAFAARKLKLSPKLTLSISVVVLLFYGIITGFPSGLKRAAIMTVVCLAAPILRGKNDPLNTLGIACFLIVITNPRELFDISFIMSAAAVLGITMFYKPFAETFSGNAAQGSIRKRVAEGTALTLSANTMLLPVCSNVFNSIAIYSVVANLIVLPLISVTFTVLAIVAILTLIFPGFGVLYYIVQYPIIAIRVICRFIYSLPYATVSTGSLGVSSVFYLLAVTTCSRYVKLERTTKIIVVSVLTVLWAASYILL